MAESQSRTDTVGNTIKSLRRTLQKLEASRKANGKWQARRLQGEWLLISPSGEVAMTGTADHMREWAFRMARIVAEASKPF